MAVFTQRVSLLRQCILLPLIVLAATSAAEAQFGRGGTPREVELVVRVFYEGGQQPAGAWLTVQLMDGFGSIEAEKLTDREGIVRFQTLTGVHRLRVIGPEIEEYNSRLELEDVETRRMEILRVRPKPGAAPMGQPGKGTIPAIRLKAPANARRELEKGAQALERKEWAEAKKRFESAIALYPNYDQAYNGLGTAAIGLRDLEAARRAFEKAISLNETYVGAHCNLARILFAERRYADAEVLLAKSLENEPLNTWVLTFLAYAQLLTHNFDKAIANARKVHTLPHEGFANAHAIAAKALEATGQPEQALAEYQLYLIEDPNGPNAAQARDAVARISSYSSK